MPSLRQDNAFSWTLSQSSAYFSERNVWKDYEKIFIPFIRLSADDIRHMSEDDLLDMDYFLNEDDEFDEDFPGAEGFYLF